jgi:TolB protein
MMTRVYQAWLAVFLLVLVACGAAPTPTTPTPTPAPGRIAFTSLRDGNWEIYVMNADGTGLTRLTNHHADDRRPAWSPDGTRIAFVSNRDLARGNFNWEIYVMNADGTGVTRLTNHPDDDRWPDWR